MATKIPSTNKSLLARLRKRKDVEAWSLFVNLYTPLVYDFARRRGLQDADASDVTQKVIARVYGVFEKFEYDPERGRFRDWLGTIVNREVIRHHHREARGRGAGGGRGDSEARRVPSAPEGDWLEEFNSHVLRTALERIRNQFDEATWKAFALTWLQSVETQDAAAQLGKTPAWIYKARFRVLKRLREEVEFIADDAAVLQRPM
jgi:RNA polymerase sigma-70 factor (ECF subfamily)